LHVLGIVTKTDTHVKKSLDRPFLITAMAIKLEQLKIGTCFKGLRGSEILTVVKIDFIGADIINLIFRTTSGVIDEALIYRDEEQNLEAVTNVRPWGFDADGTTFRLVSEAFRIQLAHLFDPLLAINTSIVEPLPHQITAVYESMLPRQPLRFLLADDPGAGKTIMAGLLIKEFIARGDVQRCLIVCPGSLVDQWQDELFSKFNLHFDILTNDSFESAVTGNWFLEHPLAIVRLDKFARDEDLQSKLNSEHLIYDLVICDEAHKMAATFFGNEIKYTKRYKLGRLLGQRTRHLLLMTATPHNGKESDFQLFMGLLDGDRFEGKFRDGVHSADVSDLMRRMVKESLVKFDGRPLFPERRAYTVPFKFSEEEAILYKEVTEYVRQEFNRAETFVDERRKGTVGFAMTVLQRRLASSPEALYRSICRRKGRLESRLQEILLSFREHRHTEKLPSLDEIDDFDDFPDDEQQQMEEIVLDEATAARTADELTAEIKRLSIIESMAFSLRNSGKDAKWLSLENLLSIIFPDQKQEAKFTQKKGPSTNASAYFNPTPGQKLIIFTEHRDTLNYLVEKINQHLGRHDRIQTIHGGMGREERKKAQERFLHDSNVNILIATDAAGEGINLQRANLMINYDLPWNPNRLEQRFGRIHRIGQSEVCHLWNLVADETREGDVYKRLLQKLEEARLALGGKVFDVLGKLEFGGKTLRDLIIEAIRYGEQDEVKARLNSAIENAVDKDHLLQLLDDNALSPDSIDNDRLQRIRFDMERAQARRLQPYYIESFFLEAFKKLGGRISLREDSRYEITNVPSIIRNRERQISRHNHVLPKYERITFNKHSRTIQGKALAAFIFPGHPLLDSVLDITLERHRNLLRQGSVLVDDDNPATSPTVVLYLDHTIQDQRKTGQHSTTIVSRRMLYVHINANNDVNFSESAPYLDYRPLNEDEPNAKTIIGWEECQWISRELENIAVSHAVQHIVPEHLNEVKQRKLHLIEKTRITVKERLTKEILYWENRSNQLMAQERAGRNNNPNLNANEARKRAEDLAVRLEKRMNELRLESGISARQPIVIGAFVVIPKGLLLANMTKPSSMESLIDRQEAARKAREIVLELERLMGFDAIDVELEKRGYDIESRPLNPNEKVRFIEVKGRDAKAETITVTRNEMMYCRNKQEQYYLALVLFLPDNQHEVYYVQNPFEKEPDFAVSSANYEIKKLLSQAKRVK
jgi:superfamily II DNA or RNA helicase